MIEKLRTACKASNAYTTLRNFGIFLYTNDDLQRLGLHEYYMNIVIYKAAVQSGSRIRPAPPREGIWCAVYAVYAVHTTRCA